MNISPLTAISPVDGRYAAKTEPLRLLLSEFGLIKARLTVEIRWLQALAEQPEIAEVPKLSGDANAFLQALIDQFDQTAAAEIKTLETTTNHDVKAVEYYLKQALSNNEELNAIKEFVHFACTSEDINNISYALLLQQASRHLEEKEITSMISMLQTLSQQNSNLAMLSRTHGQSASPTTLGKEMANFVTRLKRQLEQLSNLKVYAKMNGATGNYNAHVVAYPNIDWESISRHFIENLGLSWNRHTTQIEPHDWIAEMAHHYCRINTLLIDFARDVWGYISLGYFTQKTVANEVGSSTMPHKVNPIDFENAEGNLGIANALLNHFADKLPISRWQRDLTDSTVLRNVGVALAHCLIAYCSLEKGIGKLQVNTDAIEKDLNAHVDVLSEAVQTVMRRYGLPEPYEQLKAITRGKQIDPATLRNFIEQLNLPSDIKETLLGLTPAEYIGLAQKLAQEC